MKKLTNNCPTVIHEVIVKLHNALRPGEEVTDHKWNCAYKAVRALAIADTLVWKAKHITKAKLS